ncbi:hypothetical protein SMICM304S_05838 [Streptomyces microflavus]
MQRALSVGEGRMLLAGKVNAGTEVKLVLALHHLISDGVSLRVLARDIRTALREAPAELRLPPVAATFSSWIAATHLRVASPEVQGQIPYWTEVASKIRSPFPRTALTESGTVDREFGVSAEVTGRLARIGASVAGAELQHALLATLTRAYCDAFGESGFPVLLEGHGRSDSPGSPDISGTVGWFTSMYPTVLRGAAAGGPVADVQAVRGQLRAIPNGGNDYGALSYLDHSVPPLASAVPVAFNYLGAMPSGMELASSAYGDFRSGASRRECAIEFNIFKYGDDLKVSMRVDRAFADLPAVLKLQAEYERTSHRPRGGARRHHGTSAHGERSGAGRPSAVRCSCWTRTPAPARSVFPAISMWRPTRSPTFPSTASGGSRSRRARSNPDSPRPTGTSIPRAMSVCARRRSPYPTGRPSGRTARWTRWSICGSPGPGGTARAVTSSSATPRTMGRTPPNRQRSCASPWSRPPGRRTTTLRGPISAPSRGMCGA